MSIICLPNFLLFQSDVEIDQKSTCFICDLPNHEFERKGTVRKNAYIHYTYYGSDKLMTKLEKSLISNIT